MGNTGLLYDKCLRFSIIVMIMMVYISMVDVEIFWDNNQLLSVKPVLKENLETAGRREYKVDCSSNLETAGCRENYWLTLC